MSTSQQPEVDKSTETNQNQNQNQSQNEIPEIPEHEKRERIAKGAAVSGLLAGVGAGVIGLGAGPAGVAVGLVVGIGAGGTLGLAAFGQGGKINKVAEVTGTAVIKVYDKAKVIDNKYKITEKGSHHAQNLIQKAKKINDEHHIDVKIKGAAGAATALADRVGKAVSRKMSKGEVLENKKSNESNNNYSNDNNNNNNAEEQLVQGANETEAETETEAKVLAESILFLESRITRDQGEDVVYNLSDSAVMQNWLSEKVEVVEGTKMIETWTFMIMKQLDNVVYTRISYRNGIMVSKENVQIGSLEPKEYPVAFAFDEIEIPKGMFVRGNYKSKMILSCQINGKEEIILRRSTQVSIIAAQ